MNRPLVALGLALVLGVVAVQVAHKEAVLADGRPVLLELAPVDPRSLMQGDYMVLRYAIADDMRGDDWPEDGLAVLVADADGIARLVGPDTGRALGPDELRLRYRRRGGHVRIGAESYFFEEGTGDRYAEARYGVLRVEPGGESVLIGLAGVDRAVIEAP